MAPAAKINKPQFINLWRFETNLGTCEEVAPEGLCCLLCVKADVKHNYGSADALIAHCSSYHNYLEFKYKRGLVTVLYVKKTQGTISATMRSGMVWKNSFEWRNVLGAQDLLLAQKPVYNRFNFLDLPPELRCRIYEDVFVSPTTLEISATSPGPPKLLEVNHQIRDEATEIYYNKNKFEIVLQNCDIDPVMPAYQDWRACSADHGEPPMRSEGDFPRLELDQSTSTVPKERTTVSHMMDIVDSLAYDEGWAATEVALEAAEVQAKIWGCRW